MNKFLFALIAISFVPFQAYGATSITGHMNSPEVSAISIKYIGQQGQGSGTIDLREMSKKLPIAPGSYNFTATFESTAPTFEKKYTCDYPDNPVTLKNKNYVIQATATELNTDGTATCLWKIY